MRSHHLFSMSFLYFWASQLTTGSIYLQSSSSSSSSSSSDDDHQQQQQQTIISHSSHQKESPWFPWSLFSPSASAVIIFTGLIMFCLRIMFTILSTTTLKGALKNYQPWFHPSIFVKHHEAFDIKHIQTLHPGKSTFETQSHGGLNCLKWMFLFNWVIFRSTTCGSIMGVYP